MIIKYIFAFIIALHGLIHFMGFAKAFSYGNMVQLTKDISKPVGVLWFATALLFLIAMILFLMNNENWAWITIIAAIISQILIFSVWQDAKFGTIANILALAIAISGWASLNFESHFKKDVWTHLQQTNTIQTQLLTEANIQYLPQPVQKYLRYTGVINQPKINNVRLVFEGEMREKGKDWFSFRSVQYNFFDDPTRLFFLKAKMFGLPVLGYHDYQNAKANMDIRLLGLYAVVKAKGDEMNKAETVTVFNDMCLMFPATLIDTRIEWTAIDSTSAKATFTNAGNKISATLYFNEMGQLVNFISDDRYVVGDMRQYRFSTPVKDYKLINGINVPTYGEAIWHYPDGEFIYGKFYLKSIEYNNRTL